MPEPKYPHVTVMLVGEDGNAFAILARCRPAARRAGLPRAEIDTFLVESTADDYDHLLQTCILWWEVE